MLIEITLKCFFFFLTSQTSNYQYHVARGMEKQPLLFIASESKNQYDLCGRQFDSVIQNSKHP